MQTVSTDLHPQGADTPLSADLSADLTTVVTRKIGEIILDPNINTREVDRDVVTDYKEAMQGYGASWQDSWNELPRITESNHLWSGFHTICAAIEIFGPQSTVKCRIEGENERDAYFLATRANHMHGRRRTNAEKEAAVLRWIEDEEMCQWTDGYIAKMCHVSDVLVGKIRERTPNIRSQPTKRKFINAKGEIEWMHTSRIGLTPPPAPDPQKQIKTDFKAYIKHRDAAYDAWKRFCDRKEILFDWDEFCQHAEPHLGGLVSLINPEDTTLDEIREKSQIWQKLTNAITGEAGWVTVYEVKLKFSEKKEKKAEADTSTDAEPIPAEEGDLEGLRKNLARVFDIGVTPNAEVQSNMHHVPLDVVEAEIEKAKASRGMESSEPAAETDDADQKRSLTMEEVEFLYAEIEGEIGDLTEPEQVEVRQFLKVNYDAYPTYQWRDMLKIDALETLAETLDQIDRGIKEKGVEAFKLSDPPLVSERTEPEQPAPLLSYPEATGQQILNCKGGLSELIEAEGIPLVIKFAAEDFLETIEKHLLTKDREDA